MQDDDCVRFLQWALPQLHMRWPGFRRVHKRVCQRLGRRLTLLGLGSVDAYREYLLKEPGEWQQLDTLCQVVVTRFYRDKRVFVELTESILPQLALRALRNGHASLRAWCIGSASGEEPYTLAILWHLLLAPRFPQRLSILATEVNPILIARSLCACYAQATIKNLPSELASTAFDPIEGNYCLKSPYKAMVEFRLSDIRTTLPEGHFDLILCRNLVFTYFDGAMQRTILNHLVDRLLPGGWLVVGVHEALPADRDGLQVISEPLGLYQRIDKGAEDG